MGYENDYGRESPGQQLRSISPFAPCVDIDDDLSFAARCMAIFGPFYYMFVDQQLVALDGIAEALSPLRERIGKQRTADVRAFSEAKDPVMIAAYTALLRWPLCACRGGMWRR